MRRLIGLLAILACSSLFAQDKPKEAQDPFDISATAKQAKELGIPTVSELTALEAKTTELYDAGKWKEAAEALDQFARKANWLSNLIAAGLEPFYGASYDDRKGFGGARLQELVPLEKLVNDYRAKRNHAMVMRAECLVKLGAKQEAASVLVRALDLIDIDDQTWWQRARKQLYELIEVPS